MGETVKPCDHVKPVSNAVSFAKSGLSGRSHCPGFKKPEGSIEDRPKWAKSAEAPLPLRDERLHVEMPMPRECHGMRYNFG